MTKRKIASKNFTKLSKSSNSTEYGTPLDLYSKLNKIFKFELDPCASSDPKYYLTMRNVTKEMDGLKREWDANTFINPPFGRGIDAWLYKMYSQATIHENNKYVMLLPARVETKWFQDSIMTIYRDDSVIYFLKGRLKFVNPTLNSKSEPHIIGSMLWIMNSNKKELYELKQAISGILLHDWDNNGVGIKNNE